MNIDSTLKQDIQKLILNNLIEYMGNLPFLNNLIKDLQSIDTQHLDTAKLTETTQLIKNSETGNDKIYILAHKYLFTYKNQTQLSPSVFKFRNNKISCFGANSFQKKMRSIDQDIQKKFFNYGKNG